MVKENRRDKDKRDRFYKAEWFESDKEKSNILWNQTPMPHNI